MFEFRLYNKKGEWLYTSDMYGGKDNFTLIKTKVHQWLAIGKEAHSASIYRLSGEPVLRKPNLKSEWYKLC